MVSKLILFKLDQLQMQFHPFLPYVNPGFLGWKQTEA